MYLCPCWVFITACGLSLVVASGSYSLVAVHRLQIAGLLLLQSKGSRHVGSTVVVHRLSCPVACGILVPRPGIEPMSPVLAGRFLTTEVALLQ